MNICNFIYKQGFNFSVSISFKAVLSLIHLSQWNLNQYQNFATKNNDDGDGAIVTFMTFVSWKCFNNFNFLEVKSIKNTKHHLMTVIQNFFPFFIILQKTVNFLTLHHWLLWIMNYSFNHERHCILIISSNVCLQQVVG